MSINRLQHVTLQEKSVKPLVLIHAYKKFGHAMISKYYFPWCDCSITEK